MMKNKIFAELEKKVEAWKQEKETREADLRESLENAQAGFDAAQEDSEKFMKSGELKKYTDAETRKDFYNKRINYLSDQLADLEVSFLSPEQYKEVSAAIHEEQTKLLKKQKEKMLDILKNLQDLVSETTERMAEGNKILITMNAELFDQNHAENFFANTRNNQRAETIVQNYWYTLQFNGNVPHHFQNARYSKFVAGVKFVDE